MGTWVDVGCCDMRRGRRTEMGFRNVEGSACLMTNCPGVRQKNGAHECRYLYLFPLELFTRWGAEVMRPFTDHQQSVRRIFTRLVADALFVVCVSPTPLLFFQLVFSWIWRMHSSDPKPMWHHRGYRGSGGWYTTGCRGAGAFWQMRWGWGRPFRYDLPPQPIVFSV